MYKNNALKAITFDDLANRLNPWSKELGDWFSDYLANAGQDPLEIGLTEQFALMIKKSKGLQDIRVVGVSLNIGVCRRVFTETPSLGFVYQIYRDPKQAAENKTGADFIFEFTIKDGNGKEHPCKVFVQGKYP